MRRVGRVAEVGERMRVHQPAQMDKLTDLLPAVELELGRARGEKEPRELSATKEVSDFRRRHIDQKQDANPEIDGEEMIPGKRRQA